MITKRLHIIPLGDLDDHEASVECWCYPYDDHEGVVTHNAKDCREQMERAGKPTGKIWCRIAETYDDMIGSVAVDEERPTYRCEKCQKTTRELDHRNWLHRINVGQTPSLWLCNICINLP